MTLDENNRTHNLGTLWAFLIMSSLKILDFNKVLTFYKCGYRNHAKTNSKKKQKYLSLDFPITMEKIAEHLELFRTKVRFFCTQVW